MPWHVQSLARPVWNSCLVSCSTLATRVSRRTPTSFTRYSTGRLSGRASQDLCRKTVRAQREVVQLLLDEICHVFAAMPHLSDIALFSFSAHLMGILRWLATGTQAICEQHSGNALSRRIPSEHEY